MSDKNPTALSELEELVGRVLEEGGLQKPDAEAYARKVATRIGEEWGGLQVYIAKKMLLAQRDREIFNRFDGSNHAVLAKEYDLTERQIYNVLSRVRSEEIRMRQHSLFPEE